MIKCATFMQYTTCRSLVLFWDLIQPIIIVIDNHGSVSVVANENVEEVSFTLISSELELAFYFCQKLISNYLFCELFITSQFLSGCISIESRINT